MRRSFFRNMSKKQIRKVLEEEVFSQRQFKRHVIEVAHDTKIDKDLVEIVLRSYMTNILIALNVVRKIKTKINVYGFFSLTIAVDKKYKNK